MARNVSVRIAGSDGPGDEGRELEVAMCWGESVLDVRRFPGKALVSAGNDPRDDFQLDCVELGARHVLATSDGARCALAIPTTARVTARRAGIATERAALVAEGRLEVRPGAPDAMDLGAQELVEVGVGAVSFRARWVPRAPRVVADATTMDYGFAKAATLSVMVACTLVAAFLLTDTGAQPLSEDLSKSGKSYAGIFRSPTRPVKKQIKLPARETPKKDVERYSAREEKTHSRGPLNPLKRDKDLSKVRSAGLLGLLDGANGSTSNVFSNTGLGTNINEALGTLRNDGVVDSHGIGGLGSRNIPGGGGNELGIGGIGTRPGGRGHGGPDFHFGAGDPPRRDTLVLPPKTLVSGSCERTVIGRVVGRHASEIRFCYESELGRSPALAGKIAVSFTVDPTGGVSDAAVAQSTLGSETVEQCVLARIRRWRFPEPKGGGVCIINYPWVFRAAGSADEE